MKKLVLALGGMLLLAACETTINDPGPGPGPGPDPNARNISFRGYVARNRGRCSIIRTVDGQRLAVRGGLRRFRNGTRVVGSGRIRLQQRCAGATEVALRRIRRVGPPPRQRPERVFYSAQVLEKFGRCHTLLARDGRRYSVYRGSLRGMPRGAWVRISADRRRYGGCRYPRLRIRSIRRL